MNTRARTLTAYQAMGRAAAGAGGVALLMLASSPPGQALPATPVLAAGNAQLTADGQPLDGSVQPAGQFTAAVAAPAGVTVKFKIDGTYLGQDSTQPYSWPIRTGPGSHRVEARWDLGGRQEVAADFQVAAAVAPPSSQPAPAPSPSPAAVVKVSSAAELSAALQQATPGQTIQLGDGLYVGKFEAAASGTAAAPITLTGSRAAVLSTGSTGTGYGLHVTGSQWRISGLTVKNASKGIVLDGSMHTVISNVDVGGIGSEGVHFRKNSSDSSLRDSDIHDTGLAQPGYGEGIYVGSAKSNWDTVMGSAAEPDRSNRVQIINNRIFRTSAEGVDAKEGTSGGLIRGNTFSDAGYSGANSADSWVDVKGNGYTVEGNTGSTAKTDAFQVHSVQDGWGVGNVFSANAVLGGVPGYEVWVQSPHLGTVIACKESSAGRGLSNIPCAA